MTDETTARHCEACGQVKLPSDYWQRKITCWQDLAIANRKVADYWQRKITYWQDLACANRKVAEDAQAQRDKAREDALEEAAKVCEQPSDEIQVTDELSKYTYKDCFDCAAAIRAMKKECGK